MKIITNYTHFRSSLFCGILKVFKLLTSVRTVIFSLLTAFSIISIHSQIALPTISITPYSSNICDSCVNLTANIESALGTTNSYVVSEIPYSPFSYNSGVPILVHIDDQWSSAINLPFCFQFYGNTYTHLLVGSNQIITFDIGIGNYCPFNLLYTGGIPNLNIPPNSIMGPYQDIDPSVSGNTYIQTVGTAPFRKFIISYYETPYFVCNGITSTSQFVLYETTNIIDIYIKSKPVCSTWNQGLAIEGIQNASGNLATTVFGRNNTLWSASDDANRFTPAGMPQYTITWYDSNNTIIGTEQTISVCPAENSTYTATLTTNTCGTPLIATDSATVNLVGIQSINIASTPTSCIANTGTATATVTGYNSSYSYLWNPTGQTTQTATGLASGTYLLTVTSSNGCAKTESITIVNLNTIELTLSSTPINCLTNNGSAIVAVNGGVPGYIYLWSNGSTSSVNDVSQAGTISVTVTDAIGCTQSASTTISSPIYPTAIAMTNSPICSGDSIILNSENLSTTGLITTYNWAGPNLFFSTLKSPTIYNSTSYNSGLYTVIITENGCSDTSERIVVINPIPIVNFTADTIEGCQPLKVFFKNNSLPSDGNLVWEFGDGNVSNNSQSNIYMSSGFFDVTLTTTSNNCSNSLSKNKYIHVLARANPSFSVCSITTTNTTTSTIYDPTFIFTNTSLEASTYLWLFGDASSATNIDITHTYPPEQNNFEVILYANNENNCPDSTTRKITILEPLVYYIPNTFTPDGNNFNDLFQPIFTSGYDPQDFQMQIYNKWGEIIFESKDANIGWNGTYKDKIVEDGVYTWEIRFKKKFTAEKKIINGTVNLIR